MEIVKGIPIPEKPTGRPKKYDYSFLDRMVKDDMVRIPIEDKETITYEAKIIRNHIGRYKKKNPNRNYTVRSIEDGIGIWRIE